LQRDVTTSCCGSSRLTRKPSRRHASWASSSRTFRQTRTLQLLQAVVLRSRRLQRALRQFSRQAIVPVLLAVLRRALGLKSGNRIRSRLNLQLLQVTRPRPSNLRVLNVLTTRQRWRATRSGVAVPRAARGGITSGSGTSAAAYSQCSSSSSSGVARGCNETWQT